MKSGRRGYRLARWIVATVLAALVSTSQAQPIEQSKIEAAMTAQLLNFTEWSAEAGAPEKEKVVVGVYANPELLSVYQALFTDPLYHGRYSARLIEEDEPTENLKAIDALVFGASTPPRDIARAIKRTERLPIVLISSADGFLELGGMVNFTKKQKRLGFEIDLNHSREHGITYRAKLLRLATRIIGE